MTYDLIRTTSLTQANAEKLLDAEVLASAEGDLMITGPALCLYFAALRCTTNPPSVPLPRHKKNTQPLDLSTANCPPAFTAFLNVWCAAVPRIQALLPEQQHDLARIICGLAPVGARDTPALNGIAADLRAVAIEISQRRSFQERYTGDLQAAIDAGPSRATGLKVKASFVPPPEYQPSPTSSQGSSPLPSPRPAPHDLPPPMPMPHLPNPHPLSIHHPHPRAPQDAALLSPYPGPSAAPRTPSPAPRLASPDAPAIEAIRETLYAALGDVLARTPTLRALLHSDPPRAYFAAVALAILEVATTAVTPDGAVVGVLGRPLTLAQCPAPLRPLMGELGAIGGAAREVEEADTEEAMRLAQDGEDIPPPRMERVRRMLQEGVACEAGGRRSVEGRAVAFANRVNELALKMTRLKQFRDRQEDVFKVLGGIGS
ncbi:hypothetical protein HWV62_16514 [Athelia sp. TMB]|nr:hypothetical protein HWV62_16514 [Athelia sp. TMB]